MLKFQVLCCFWLFGLFFCPTVFHICRVNYLRWSFSLRLRIYHGFAHFVCLPGERGTAISSCCHPIHPFIQTLAPPNCSCMSHRQKGLFPLLHSHSTLSLLYLLFITFGYRSPCTVNSWRAADHVLAWYSEKCLLTLYGRWPPSDHMMNQSGFSPSTSQEVARPLTLSGIV